MGPKKFSWFSDPPSSLLKLPYYPFYWHINQIKTKNRLAYHFWCVKQCKKNIFITLLDNKKWKKCLPPSLIFIKKKCLWNTKLTLHGLVYCYMFCMTENDTFIVLIDFHDISNFEIRMHDMYIYIFIFLANVFFYHHKALNDF